MIHQPLGGAEGQASDVEIRARQLLLIIDAAMPRQIVFTFGRMKRIVSKIDMPAETEPPGMSLVPIVVESSGRSERSFDIYSRLLRDRIIFLTTEVNDQTRSNIMAEPRAVCMTVRAAFAERTKNSHNCAFFQRLPGRRLRFTDLIIGYVISSYCC